MTSSLNTAKWSPNILSKLVHTGGLLTAIKTPTPTRERLARADGGISTWPTARVGTRNSQVRHTPGALSQATRPSRAFLAPIPSWAGSQREELDPVYPGRSSGGPVSAGAPARSRRPRKITAGESSRRPPAHAWAVARMQFREIEPAPCGSRIIDTNSSRANGPVTTLPDVPSRPSGRDRPLLYPDQTDRGEGLGFREYLTKVAKEFW